VLDRPATADEGWNGNDPDPATSHAPYRIYNIGNDRPVLLLDYIAAIERTLGKKAKLDLQPMQPGDVASTQADVTELERAIGFRPRTSIDEGIRRFVEWYRGYYGC
jgi:UDP-glucuronate 4-epimerase